MNEVIKIFNVWDTFLQRLGIFFQPHEVSKLERMCRWVGVNTYNYISFWMTYITDLAMSGHSCDDIIDALYQEIGSYPPEEFE